VSFVLPCAFLWLLFLLYQLYLGIDYLFLVIVLDLILTLSGCRCIAGDTIRTLSIIVESSRL
jgi:hypothetical protein